MTQTVIVPVKLEIDGYMDATTIKEWIETQIMMLGYLHPEDERHDILSAKCIRVERISKNINKKGKQT